jgi:hypothetical protein
MFEKYQKLDLSKYNIDVTRNNYFYEISNLGTIRKVQKRNNKVITYYNGFFKGKGNHEGNFSVKIERRVFPIYKLVLEHFTDLEIQKYNVSFIDNNKKNCSIDNIKVILKHKYKNTEESKKLLYESYISNQLHRVLNYKLSSKLFNFKSVYQREDLIHDFYFFCFDRLYDYETKNYKDFTGFLFLKADDFIYRIRQKRDYINGMQSLEEIASYKKTQDRLAYNVRNGCFFTDN